MIFWDGRDRLEGEGVGNKCEEKHETESISSEKENSNMEEERANYLKKKQKWSMKKKEKMKSNRREALWRGKISLYHMFS